jgi:predicted TIM-barrel enzyme
MTRHSRAELVAKFQDMARRGEPIIGGGAGTGLSAKCEEAGGIDLIVIYNSGRYRMAGRGSLAGLLAYGNANEIVVEMAAEVLPVVRHTPVLAGVNGTDPFLITDRFLRELADLGFAGIQNFPTVGLIDGAFRANLEETGMGYDLEVELIAAARAADLLTTPYVFSADDARAMTRAGADIVVCHMGLTTGGTIGAETAKTLDDCVTLIDEWAAAAREVRDDVLVLCHGGPIAMPDDAAYVLERTTQCHGFYGASSMERLPTEKALTEQTRAFKTRLNRQEHVVARPYASGVVPASADAVWSLIRDFNGMPEWHPAITASELTEGGSGTEVGAVRRLTLGDGGAVVERLLELNDADRRFTYEFLENPFGVRRYVATLRVAPVTTSGESFVEWWAEFDAEAADEERLVNFFAGAVYGSGITALAKRFAA